MEVRRSTLCDNFQAGAAGARETRRVRIVVDLHFLHCGGRDAGTVGFDPIYYQGHAVGAGGVVVQESGHRGDVILIKDGNAVESVTVYGVGILVFGSLSADNRDVNPGGYSKR